MGGTTAQKVTINDTETEYLFQISEAKKLFDEWQKVTPEDFRLRLKEKINYLADLLETVGVPAHKVVGKIFNDLDGIYSERHLRRLLGDNAELDEKTDSVSENNTSVPTEYEIRNTRMIELTDRLISFFKDVFRKKLSLTEYESQLDGKLLQEHIYTLNNLLDTAEECLDERQTVPIIAQHMLFTLIASKGPAFAAETFQTKIKNLKLTPKQTTNYRLGQIREMHPLYDPHDEEEAIMSPAKFYGVKCDYLLCLDCEKNDPDSDTTHGNKLTAKICAWCGSTNLKRQGCYSYRVKLGNQADDKYTVHCFACQSDFIPTTKPLPRTSNDVVVNVVTLQAPPNVTATVGAW